MVLFSILLCISTVPWHRGKNIFEKIEYNIIYILILTSYFSGSSHFLIKLRTDINNNHSLPCSRSSLSLSLSLFAPAASGILNCSPSEFHANNKVSKIKRIWRTSSNTMEFHNIDVLGGLCSIAGQFCWSMLQGQKCCCAITLAMYIL